MIIKCPIKNCDYQHEIPSNIATDDIYDYTKDVINTHRENSKACAQYFCSCGHVTSSIQSRNRHTSSYHNKPNQAGRHIRLSYLASLVKDNETRIIHVDSLESVKNIPIFLPNFGSPQEVVYGSTIGKSVTVSNPKQHSMHEFTRTGTNLDFRPRKALKTDMSEKDEMESTIGNTASIKNHNAQCSHSSSVDINNPYTSKSSYDSHVLNESNSYMANFDCDDNVSITDSIHNSDSPHALQPSVPTLDSNVTPNIDDITQATQSNKRITRSSSKKSKSNTKTMVEMSQQTGIRTSLRSFSKTRSTPTNNLPERNSKSASVNEHTCENNFNHGIDEIETISRVSGTNRCLNTSSIPNRQVTTENQDISTFFSTHIEQDNAHDGNRLDEDGANLESLTDDGWGNDDGNSDSDEDQDEEMHGIENNEENIDENEGPADRELRAALRSLTMNQEIYGMSDKLPEYRNQSLPERTPEQMASVDTTIQYMVDEIKEHRKCNSLSSSTHMKYFEILVEMNRSNAPQSLFDSVASLIHEKFDDRGDNRPPPTRQKMISWIEKQVHPKSLMHLSKPKSKFLRLPSGRSVTITYFDYRYQLALLLSNDEIMDAANLLFPNLEDIFELPLHDCPLDDVNSGFFHQKMTRAACRFKGDILFPFIDFCDGTNVSRNSIEPYLRSFGILKRSIRNKPEAWFPLGFFEPIVNYSPLAPGVKYDSTAKLSDYHGILSFLFEPVIELERTGFQYNLNLGEHGQQSVVFMPCTQLTLGDCKGGNIFCAKFGTYKGTKMLCRDCDVPSSRSARPNWKCTFINKFQMKYKTAEDLRAMSFWKITANAFDGLNQNLPDVWGVYGITPPEILHLLYIGLAVYMVGGFIFQRSGVMQKYLDESAISLYIHNKRQSLRGMPNLVAYRNGFTTDVAMTTGKEKFAKVFLLYLFFMKKDICE